MTDSDYMARALALAARGKGYTSPNPCVGAVVVKNGQIIGQGFHAKAGGPHAEVVAIDDAAAKAPEKLADATIYVTLEPCNHFGKTPPCTHKILNAGIGRVVVACKDPNPVAGGGIDFLRGKGLAVVSGVMEQAALTLIEDFVWNVQNHHTPFVTLKCAATLDGYIATRTGDSQWITSSASRNFGHELRHQNDAILIGAGTLHGDDPSLTARIAGKQTRDPARIILDTRLTIQENAKVVVQKSSAPTIIVTGPDCDPGKIQRLKDKGAQILECRVCGNLLDLNDLMIRLRKLSITSLLIEGGGCVAASALAAGIVNKVCYFLAPKMMGGNDGIPVFNGSGPEKIKDVVELVRVTTRHFDSDMLVTGYIEA
ncbi:bifunctional diaminohydroxyphosphoribosylaminopyrimidine deaminase/5-amino-6-(5-phosphoribosylamino)uracil reductase RibD [Desulfobacter latus]|uniref:Riboflavin biosynthesis protein RibD n=1 Tax=Desulfobacter latus TaxID=2292 RepID=A0A850TCL7_9BACT|nr:bifunctional diaminohydroxyphosphoribosylaminopyrimidine deaminase/5-amino-6-(5-phosphoribosylamino)uracil reductase RibD [Desulfobacter latus]NWH05136.1 bifunctional diaminohydroxyphosphoribosylaminopyrimidine deaminase/5-amino-6-(5-phosphoribosylamino)uracil reductase RibD [Desulfobacter latus]